MEEEVNSTDTRQNACVADGREKNTYRGKKHGDNRKEHVHKKIQDDSKRKGRGDKRKEHG